VAAAFAANGQFGGAAVGGREFKLVLRVNVVPVYFVAKNDALHAHLFLKFWVVIEALADSQVLVDLFELANAERVWCEWHVALAAVMLGTAG